MHYDRADLSTYPRDLLELEDPPARLTTSGPLHAARAVAIVGSRRAIPEALAFARALAFLLARANIVVISGGAVGVDTAAHRGAIDGGGATWVVSPVGRDHVYPPQNVELFAAISRSEHSRMIWPFADARRYENGMARFRNGVLVALAEVVVVIQAHFKSGSRNAASFARRLNRPLWIVPAAPWMEDFAGSLADLEHDLARPLWSFEGFFAALGLPRPDRDTVEEAGIRPRGELDRLPRRTAPLSRKSRPQNAPSHTPSTQGWAPEEIVIFSALSHQPQHPELVAAAAGVGVGAAATALLTLAMKDVVVEGPDGFFRRRTVG